MRFSICIPTYEMRGKGVPFLNELFESIAGQTLRDFEVIVSDHSMDGRIRELCEKWQKKNVFPLRYISYDEHRGNPVANRDNAVRAARGDIIKPMDQDDFFYDKDSLKKIGETLKRHPGVSQGIAGYVHTDEYSKKFFDPVISPADAPVKPSAIFYIRSDKKMSFSGTLQTPLTTPGKLVAIRIWPFQATRYVTRKNLNIRERRDMVWLSLKRFVRKFILNPLEKI